MPQQTYNITMTCEGDPRSGSLTLEDKHVPLRGSGGKYSNEGFSLDVDHKLNVYFFIQAITGTGWNLKITNVKNGKTIVDKTDITGTDALLPNQSKYTKDVDPE